MSEPISINGKVYINFELYKPDGEVVDFQLTVDSFERLEIITECDNVLPMCELTFKLPNYSLFDIISKSETSFVLTASDVQENVEDDEVRYRISNYRITQGANGKIYYTLYGILKSDKYDKDIHILSYNMNSFEAIKQLELGEITLDQEDLYESKDKQVWIQHNCSTKEFINRILKNAFIEDGDSPLSAITLDKKLRVISIRKAFEKAAEKMSKTKKDDNTKDKKEGNEAEQKKEEPEIIVFSNHEENTIRYASYAVMTNRGILQKAFVDEREQPVIDMFVKDKGKDTNIIWKSLLNLFGVKSETPEKETKPSGTYGEGIDYPILINAGNCHENYYKAYINNIKAKALLHSLCIDLTVDLEYFKERRLRVLDIVEFKPYDESLKPIKEISGLFMITKKIVTFENGKNVTKLTLSKILL